MRTYLSPIGYNSTTVTRPVLSRGIDTGDEVVLLRPQTETDENRAAEAINDVERMLTEIEPEVELAVERLPHDDFEQSVLNSSEMLREAKPERIVNLGGGARDILLPFTIATLTHANLVDTAMFFSDIDGSVREWTMPNLLAATSEGELETLAAIRREGSSVSIPVLTDVRGVSKSTITRHVETLEKAAAVTSERQGKTKYTSITLTGQLLLRGGGID